MKKKESLAYPFAPFAYIIYISCVRLIGCTPIRPGKQAMRVLKDVLRYWYLHYLHVARERGYKNTKRFALLNIIMVQEIGLIFGGIILLHYFGYLVGVTPYILKHPVSLLLLTGFNLGYWKIFSRQKQAAVLRRARNNREVYDMALCGARFFICILILWLALIGGQGGQNVELTEEEIREFLDSIGYPKHNEKYNH